MKDEGRKDVVRVFGRWSLTNEERWLEKMAGRGWFLYEVAAPCVYRFEKGEPSKLRYAVEYGDRLLMMYGGRIVVDVSGEEKKNLTVEQLLNLFSQASGSDEVDDKLVLS